MRIQYPTAKSAVTIRKNQTALGTGVLSSLIPFHSWPVVIVPVTGSRVASAIAQSPGLSSLSKMLVLARSKRFRFDGHKA